MSGATRPALLVTFAATGFSALTLQVVWQRVLSLHAGIDLLAATTVVHRVHWRARHRQSRRRRARRPARTRRSVLLFALANAGVGLFA